MILQVLGRVIPYNLLTKSIDKESIPQLQSSKNFLIHYLKNTLFKDLPTNKIKKLSIILMLNHIDNFN